MKLWLKACKHCGGDLVPDTYENDGTRLCLQCGRSVHQHPLRRRGDLAWTPV